MQEMVYQDRVKLPHCAGALIGPNRFSSYIVRVTPTFTMISKKLTHVALFSSQLHTELG